MFFRQSEPSNAHRVPPHQTNSSESSGSLDSFIHLQVASSSESHTTPASSDKNAPRSSWNQGVRHPHETMASQYRNVPPTKPRPFSYDAPLKSSGGGPPVYRPSAMSIPKEPEPIKVQPPRTNTSTPHKAYTSSQSTSHHSSIPSSPSHPANRPHNPSQLGPAFHDHAAPSPHMPPYTIPLHSVGLGRSGEWVYSLVISLEEIFTGKHFKFGISRSYLSGRKKNVVIEIDIPSGCRAGTRILCRNVGHEWKPQVFQDIAFIIEEAPHDRFIRLFDDLIMDVRLPWVDGLRQQGGKVPFMGIDGRSLVVQIDYPKDKSMKGRSMVKGAGMPIREQGKVVGRGNLIVQWEILPPKTKIFHFFRSLWCK
ncbi:hypothetical protein CPC08DRAFT_750439 [Agrocybe pediades]|nr:hypothetical protein CPC08DRAFT_750439 [Agrocybe pediades]